MKFLWKNLGTRIWMLVASITLVIVFVASMVVTQIPFLKNTVDLVLGGERAVIAENKGIYELDEGLSDAKDVYEAANALNERMAGEGMVLLKNKDNALPLSQDEKKVTVFGKNSVNLVYGGSGSGDAARTDSKTIYDSLSAVNIEYNPTMKAFYEDNSKSGSGRPSNELMGKIVYGLATGENPNGYDSVRSSYSGYGDAAIVVISRVGGEGFDLPRTMRSNYKEDSAPVTGARSVSDHYLQLDTNEEIMIREACAYFDKVIIVFNTAQAMEVGFIEEESVYSALKGYDIDASKIDAAIWMGLPGTTGVMALGKILKGEINPSGHTTDTYATDFTVDPSYKNFGNNNVLNGNRYFVGDTKQDAFGIDYEEGIYVGYRYYETRGFTDGEEWYNKNVVYPFGYGLSYTDFEWTVEDKTSGDITPDTDIVVEVTVRNAGNLPGKDVIQLYYTSPYSNGEIEKSHLVLGDFCKTNELEPGASETYTLTFKAEDMKSYDYNDANKNGFKGYELEAGDYEIKVAKDAHTIVNTFTHNASKSYKIDEDVVENRFDDVSEEIKTYLSRNDWEGTFPTTPTQEDRTVSQSFIDSLIYTVNDEGQPWEVKEMPETGKAGSLTIYDMIGLDYEDEKWDALISQLTISEMTTFIGSGAYQTGRIDSIDKPRTIALDGPSGFSNFMNVGDSFNDTCFYTAACVIGATWNSQLAYDMGNMVGNEALICAKDGTPVSSWYAPGVNIHRSPFGGRNWEYYGEDGYLSGKLAAQTCIAAQKKGLITYLKHFVLNDNETDRDNTGTDAGNKKGLGGLLVWANEQAMREIYFKPFEIAVKEGDTKGIMSSFNRIGTEWVGGSYRLLTEVLRKEWGFVGAVLTDYGITNYLNEDQMIRAGGDLRLNQMDCPTADATNPTQVSCLKQAMKNILYTEVQSNLMNISVEGYLLPYWVIWVIVLNVVLFIGFACWGAAIITLTYKRNKKTNK